MQSSPTRFTKLCVRPPRVKKQLSPEPPLPITGALLLLLIGSRGTLREPDLSPLFLAFIFLDEGHRGFLKVATAEAEIESSLSPNTGGLNELSSAEDEEDELIKKRDLHTKFCGLLLLAPPRGMS